MEYEEWYNNNIPPNLQCLEVLSFLEIMPKFALCHRNYAT